MKSFKNYLKSKQSRDELHERLRTNWRNRMNSLEKKMSRGAAQIFTVIKDRCNWGQKDFPKNIRKPKKG